MDEYWSDVFENGTQTIYLVRAMDLGPLLMAVGTNIDHELRRPMSLAMERMIWSARVMPGKGAAPSMRRAVSRCASGAPPAVVNPTRPHMVNPACRR